MASIMTLHMYDTETGEFFGLSGTVAAIQDLEGDDLRMWFTSPDDPTVGRITLEIVDSVPEEFRTDTEDAGP
jgi:hypothetical protein